MMACIHSVLPAVAFPDQSGRLQASLDVCVLEMASVLDLLLRWSVLRFVEEKLQSVVKVQTFLTLLLERLALRAYQATDNEANVFLPCLCEKAGHNQERVRAGFAQLLSLFRTVYNPHRYVVFLLEVLTASYHSNSCIIFLCN